LVDRQQRPRRCTLAHANMNTNLRTLFICGVIAAPAEALRLAPANLLSRRGAAAGGAAAALLSALPPAQAAEGARKFFSTEGGVKYFDLKEGSCDLFNVACSPATGDVVQIRYKSFLSNGKMFDSSEGPGRKPLIAKLGSGQMLKGWEEVIVSMKPGGVRVLQVPPALAYGEKGVPLEQVDGTVEYLVPPNERLQFELTLVQVAIPPP